MNSSRRNLYIIGGMIAVFFLLILWKIPQWQSDAYLARLAPDIYLKLDPKDRAQVEKNAADIENSTRLTIAQIVGGLVLLAGLYFTYQNVKVAQDNAKTAQENLRLTEEGKITDRFSKAVEMLGSDKLDVRLGGIYALERICRDSQKDHWTVMEVLTAFVRENSHKKLEGQKDETPREDIQAVMSIIGRRKWSETETQALNLRKVDLSFCTLKEADFEDAILTLSNLNETDLRKTNLSNAKLGEAKLRKSKLIDANLVKTYLFKTDLTRAELQNANFNEADLRYASLDYAKLYGAELSGADVRGVSYNEILGLTLEQILSTSEFGYGSLPDDIKEQYKERQKSLQVELKMKAESSSGEKQAEE